MRKQYVLLVGLLLFVILDQLLKFQFFNQDSPFDFGALSFHFVPNYGISLGHLSDSNPLIRVVMTSTLFGLITMVYFGLVYFLWTGPELFILRLGLTLFYSGIAGNVIDRIRFGYVIDWIEVKFSFLHGVVFNIADLVQMAGIMLTIFSLFYLNEKIWRLNNLRKVKIINPTFQYAFAIKLVAIGICSTLLVGTFGHSLILALLPSSLAKDESIKIFDIGILIILLVQTLILFLFGIVLSHRISGPIYALSKFVDDLLTGNKRGFKLRSDDYHPEIEKIARDIQRIVEERHL